MFEKILLPLDGSKIAEQAFPYVVELATSFDSEVICAGICELEEKDQSSNLPVVPEQPGRPVEK